jgi:hypothetical protein
MKLFMKELLMLLNCMFEHEHPWAVGRKCLCGAAACIHYYSCHESPRQCQLCLVASHSHLPFHWAEEWDGFRFICQDLSSLGLIMGLEQEGSICHQVPKDEKPKEFTIVNTNGIHTVHIHWCHCATRPSVMQQLMHAGLFPATIQDPTCISTAFTSAVIPRQSKRKLQDFLEPRKIHYQ